MSESVIPLSIAQEDKPKQVRRLPLLDQLLREQQSLTAVERFSQHHADTKTPLQEPFYRALLPASPPGPGQQYAFEVDLDVCTGCKACVAACHSLNGLDEGETWRSVGLLHGGSLEAPVQKTVTTACHHCVDPACMKGCPVDAYEKDPVTGIVRHLDDQCIGCQYCTLTCPYEVPQYNAQKGIVRKCDMCSDRLAVGEAPACVQACPNTAIAIAVVDTSKVVEDAQGDAFLPGAPSPGITVPTTVYKTGKSLPRNLLPADFYSVRPAHQHMPLVIMLVLTQLSAGALLIDQVLGQLLDAPMLAVLRQLHAPVALALGLLALGASTLHLGRPLYAWRAVMGIRTSWMSREILAFGLFAGCASMYSLAVSPLPAKLLPPALLAMLTQYAPILGKSAAAIGMLSVFCSVMLYQVTKRDWWGGARTGFKFFGTALVLGTATLLVTSLASLPAVSSSTQHLVDLGCVALAAMVCIKVLGELSVLTHLDDTRQGELKRSALLLVSHLAGVTRLRVIAAALGGLVAPFACHTALAGHAGGAALTWAIMGLLLLIGGELLERMTFFAASLSAHAGNLPLMTKPLTLKDRALKLLRDHNGTLTQELVRTPGGFGLGQVPVKVKPDATTKVICGFCSTGCALNVHLQRGEAVNLSPASDYSVNLGMACPKGWEALSPLDAPDRATTPLLRDAGGVLRPIDWTAAADHFVSRMRAIQQKHGPQSVAFLGTGQIAMEELALLGSFAKFGMGMVHGDGNTRQCMATSVVAYKEAFGFDAPPYTYADFEASDVLVFVGANPCIAHPILWERVCRNRNNPEIIVLDPRRTETAQVATEHFSLKPKSDLVLLYAVAHVLIREGWLAQEFIAEHTNHFDEFRQHVQAFTPERGAEVSGISKERIEALARTIHEGKRVSFWWTMGVNQSHEGVRTAQAIINLALMTGNIGKPGTGANSITGQCNAMGSRLFSNTTNLLGGHAFDKPEHREKIAKVLGIDESKITQRFGYAYDQIMEGILRGEIRGLWVVATNTSHSWINQRDARDLLKRLDFLVVQDMYHTTETAQQAHLVLPAAGWGEKDGVFINSERRMGLIKQVRRAPGQALSDFRIVQLLAEAWGVGEMFSRFRDPEATFQLLKECSRGQPCDFTGVHNYAMLDAMGGVQWPLPEGTAVEEGAERRLFEDGLFFTPDQRARFIFEQPRPLPEATRPEYPFTLLTGRGSSSQWHTETRTKKSAVLQKLAPSTPYAEINPDDAARLGIKPTDWVRVSSMRGQVEVRAFVTHVVPKGQVFIPMHYASTNVLTFPAFDPYSRQPSYKACAVSIARVEAPRNVRGH